MIKVRDGQFTFIFFISIASFCIITSNVVRSDTRDNHAVTDRLTKETFAIGCPKLCGFFSIFLGAINNIAWAEYYNKTPVVYWGKHCLYYDNGMLDMDNVWEYYFEPVSNIRYQPGNPIHALYKNPSGYGIPCFRNEPCFEQNLRTYFHDIIERFVKIKPHIQEKIDSFYTKNMLHKTTIGIHLRGTDKWNDAKPFDVQVILNRANQLADEIGECQFFIATDEERLLNLARQHLRRNAIFYDTYRSQNGVAVHTRDHKPSKYRLGEDVLIDAQLLAKCDHFLHTRSNVSIVTCMFNPDIKNIYFQN
jgi:hypothetical protein